MFFNAHTKTCRINMLIALQHASIRKQPLEMALVVVDSRAESTRLAELLPGDSSQNSKLCVFRYGGSARNS